MAHHIRRRWNVYLLVTQALYIVLNPGPINSILRTVLCNDN